MKRDLATAVSRALEQMRAAPPGKDARTPAPQPGDAGTAPGRSGGKRPRLGRVVGHLARLGREPDRPGNTPPEPRFGSRSFACPHGSRPYHLYVPARKPQALLLMLHGCRQDPEDFARGTGMNALAERHGLVVAYPHQTQADNPNGCWNWFRPRDQRPDGGEPALLAALARELAQEFDIATGRVFAAGLSAGGAMAATLGVTHPDLFAAIGVHSGLPHAAAHDMLSAFAAMRGDRRPAETTAPLRTIVFHGLEDDVVHPSNGEAILAAAPGRRRREHGHAPGGRRYEREAILDPRGRCLGEMWRIEGAGHGWAGGRPAGSFTDPEGPDASAEMVRFFLGTG